MFKKLFNRNKSVPVKVDPAENILDLNFTSRNEIVLKACGIIRESTQGWGTNEEMLISVIKAIKIASTSHPMIGVEIRDMYLRMYTEDVLDVLRDELSCGWQNVKWKDVPYAGNELENN